MADDHRQANDHNLIDRTNFFRREGVPTGLPTPPSECKRARHLRVDLDDREKKRLKLDLTGKDNGGTDGDSDSDSEDEEWDASRARRRDHRYSVYSLRSRGMLAGPSSVSRQPDPSTRPTLQTFVSSHKADVFRCQSIDERTFITIPYACSYSNAAKRGGAAHLAVATEQGTVHILDTSKRRDWDVEPQRVTIQPHQNGVFDVKWSSSDELLATASGDQSIRITSIASSVRSAAQTLHVLRGHEGTVKSIAWDPNHDGVVLCSGGRDESICLWDLRVGERRGGGEETGALAPVLSIVKAHESNLKSPRPKGRGKKLTTAAPLKSITHVLYADSHPYGVVSSCSSDGILNLWDVRLPSNGTPKKSAKATKASRPTALSTSSCDPTTYGGTRRARGITTLAAGSGPTAGLLYALGADSRVHTYTTPSLDPLSGVFPTELGMHDPHAHTHPSMQSNSFYVRLAGSPCGRWLAAGNAVDGRAYLFDVANAASATRAKDVGRFGWESAVELRGQTGEVGAMDWAEGMLATCADDGTIRVWRPDVEVARLCVDDPEEMKWEWSWASNA